VTTYPYYVFNIIKGQYGYGLLDDLTAFFRARNGVVSVNVHRYTQTDTELVTE
jgi:hypothetical protein